MPSQSADAFGLGLVRWGKAVALAATIEAHPLRCGHRPLIECRSGHRYIIARRRFDQPAFRVTESEIRMELAARCRRIRPCEEFARSPRRSGATRPMGVKFRIGFSGLDWQFPPWL